ncbi:DUF6496 domain-containing protein [Luteitalea sp.]|uniref:DUF6496 domain-containing protein n=1 Tax=Luteitalea sp. TaxID=2004800 RepID=UPI000B2CB96B|nr:DUF6496 domain-containing protein [Luteitalea sp.]
MPEKKTVAEARKAKREGKAPSTQAGAFVREEIEHIRDGEHGARSAKQAIAIGLSKARRAGVKLPDPPQSASARTKAGAKRDGARADKATRPSRARSRAAKAALEHEPHAAASSTALSRHAKAAAKRRPAKARSEAAKKAARTRARRKAS